MQFKKIRIRKAAGKKKSQGGQNALNKLNSFLNAASAEPAYICIAHGPTSKMRLPTRKSARL